MEYWQREHLRKNMPKLVEFTTCNALFLTQLQAFDLLHFSDVEILRDTKGTTEQALKLYEILQKKIGAFDLLKDALRETFQTEALDIMNQYMPKLMKYGAIEYDTTLLLGEGSMSTKVYKGRFNEREAAVKVLPQSLIPEEKAMREIDFLIKLDVHKNIIRYFGKEVTNEFVLIALELCTTNLFDFVTKSRKSCPAWNVVELLKQATEGVAYLHEKGVIHRDLKPENILLQAWGKEANEVLVKVSDFGIAKKIPDGGSYLRLSTTGHGTEDWSAPEVLKYFEEDQEEPADLRMTCQMDVFSLGCIFFFVLSGGLHPFGKNRLKRLFNIGEGKAIELRKDNVSEIIPNVEQFVMLIESMIALEIAKRPTAKEILKNIDKANKAEELDVEKIVIDDTSPSANANPTTQVAKSVIGDGNNVAARPIPFSTNQGTCNDKKQPVFKKAISDHSIQKDNNKEATHKNSLVRIEEDFMADAVPGPDILISLKNHEAGQTPPSSDNAPFDDKISPSIKYAVPTLPSIYVERKLKQMSYADSQNLNEPNQILTEDDFLNSLNHKSNNRVVVICGDYAGLVNI